jgi:hypothetical protein
MAADVVLTQFLIFFVFDATLFCLLFVNELRRGLTQWPLETKELFEDRLGLKHELIAEWINLDFVARRTKCISNLIYYPFVVIALLIVSRTVFANYPPSTVLLTRRAGTTNLLQSSLTRAVFFSAMTTATAFGSLWLSNHPGTSSMGKLLALSLICTLAAAILFQPALMGPPRKINPASEDA